MGPIFINQHNQKIQMKIESIDGVIYIDGEPTENAEYIGLCIKDISELTDFEIKAE